MGILQTAMMTGGGMYAVGKLAKSMENRGSYRNPSSQYPPQNPQQAQGYWGPPPSGPSRNSPDAYYQDNNNNRQQYYDVPQNVSRGGGQDGYQYPQDVYRGDMKMMYPPAYGGPGDYQPSFEGQAHEPREQRRLDDRFDTSSLVSMAGMAMNTVGGEGKNGKSRKGMDVVGQLLKKY